MKHLIAIAAAVVALAAPAAAQAWESPGTCPTSFNPTSLEASSPAKGSIEARWTNPPMNEAPLSWNTTREQQTLEAYKTGSNQLSGVMVTLKFPIGAEGAHGEQDAWPFPVPVAVKIQAPLLGGFPPGPYTVAVLQGYRSCVSSTLYASATVG